MTLIERLRGDIFRLCDIRRSIADEAPACGGLSGNLQTAVGALDMEIIRKAASLQMTELQVWQSYHHSRRAAA